MRSTFREFAQERLSFRFPRTRRKSKIANTKVCQASNLEETVVPEAPFPLSCTFRHQPLDQTIPSIRLIFISESLSEHGLLQCNITHTTIYSSYICLSYMWDYVP